MGALYKQSKIDIYITTNIDLSTAISHEIQYFTPSGKKGTFVSTIESDNKTLFHKCLTGEINEVGNWVLWPYVVFDDNRDAYGEPVIMEILKVGT